MENFMNAMFNEESVNFLQLFVIYDDYKDSITA